MNGILKKILFLLLLLHFGGQSFVKSLWANETIPGLGTIFYNIGSNTMSSITDGYGLYHITACAATYGLAKSGGDWGYYQVMVQNKFIPIAGFPSVMLGGVVPLAVPTYLYFKGKSKNDLKMVYTGFALGQAALISMVITSGYKAITGRHPPEVFEDNKHTPDYSRDFHFGSMRRGIFDGWPSGHTTNAFAMATTLIELYPGNKRLKYWATGYAILIGWGVSTNIHWLSDAVAGALIGYVIGKSVGRSFRALMEGKKQENRISFIIMPERIRLHLQF